MSKDVRDYDSWNYIADWGGGLVMGMFAKKAKPIFFEGIPDKFEFMSLQGDWDHIGELIEFIC